jgi:predicted Zn finger-like uncharacterized protein
MVEWFPVIKSNPGRSVWLGKRGNKRVYSMKTQCPNCKSKFNVNETNVGKQAKCPKCVKPFTIEPFVETPASPAKRDEPAVVEPSVKNPEPALLPAKITETAETPAPAAPPVKSPEPITPAVKSPAPIASPATSAEPAKQEQPESKAVSKTALSKTVFVYCWTGVRIIAGILGLLGLMLILRKEDKTILIATFAAANVFLICSAAIEILLFYKMWAAIQDDKTSISPGKAVGFLFIPVFNIYWALLMVTGFAEDYNSFIQRRAIMTKDLSLALFLIYAFAFILVATVLATPMMCIFAFLGLINRAFIGYPTAAWALFALVLAAGVVHFITYILVAFKTCNAINALPDFALATPDRPERRGV